MPGANELEKIAAEIVTCVKCPLHKNRANAVPGEGNPRAEVMLIGEAPGAEEDKQGRPFVGAAGRLLNEALEKAGFSREEVFITNIVKCRPPRNRVPTEDERRACLPYLHRQLEVIKPKIICLLGRTPLETLIGPYSISKMRGRTIEKDGWLFFLTYHPAAAIYNPSLKEQFLKEVKK
ncbi:MAG TPA: uracil-DNA glycosylase [Aquificaceae bacterium]|nr:uracil-DNA glycosylase [Aquificaceae bacterium]